MGRIRPLYKKGREERASERERENERGESSSVGVSADTSGQLLVPQIHRMPWCLPTVSSNSWARGGVCRWGGGVKSDSAPLQTPSPPLCLPVREREREKRGQVGVDLLISCCRRQREEEEEVCAPPLCACVSVCGWVGG